MTRNPTDPSGQLRELLRRMEQIPTDEALVPRRDDDGARLDTSRAVLSSWLRRDHAARILLGAVGVAAVLAAAAALLLHRPSAGELSAKTEHPPAPAVVAPPVTQVDATYRLADAGETIVPQPAAAPVREARVQTAAAPTQAPRPSLSVPPITATAGRRVRVAVGLELGSLAASGAQLHVYGLPDGARFSHGAFVAPDHWVIATADLETLELALAESVEGRFYLTIELHAAGGRQLAGVKSRLVVAAPPAVSTPAAMAASTQGLPRSAEARPRVAVAAPAAAPAPVVNPPAVSAAPAVGPPPTATSSDVERLDEQTQDKFLIQGLRLLVMGNINSARLLFERAAGAGNARAALLLGDTFDDVRLAQLGVLGVVPDRVKSIYWYERADELGAPEAKERLSELNLR